MEFLPGGIYHVYNQGNDRQPVFFGKDNYLFFLRKMRNHLIGHCDLFAWCLMPNHFHWLIRVHDNYPVSNQQRDPVTESTAPKIQPLNRAISILLSSYTKAINKAYNKSGSLFRSRTRSKLMSGELTNDDKYPLICFLYIHQNPLRAGLVNTLEEWEFSSYRDFTGIRNGSLCQIEKAKELFDLPERIEGFIKFSKQTIPEYYLKEFV